ncbi:MAG: thiamine pyrophosphate-dependent enzyme [Myxococcota bacterium]
MSDDRPAPPTVPIDRPPEEAAKRLGHFRPRLLLHEDHDLCPGCGEPVAIRILLDAIEELGCAESAIGVIGIGCYTAFTSTLDVDLVQALHGRAPSVATGAKRMRPDCLLFTLQGDGDMVNEGLQEVLHTAARGEAVTCVLLNNGVFGETGGHMTATTTLGQRTKNSLEGRDAAYHGHPIRIGDLIAPLGGTAYAARGSVHDAASVVKTKAMLRRAFEAQLEGRGFSFVEILTMCPTGWFVPTAEGPDYLENVLRPVHFTGELKNAERCVTTEQLLEENAAAEREAAARGARQPAR